MHKCPILGVARMKHRLSFATLNLLSDSIVEIHIDDGVEVSIEMIEEFDHYLNDNLSERFAMLINRVNNYHCTFEAKMTAVSHGELCATAIVTYNSDDTKEVDDLLRIRKIDELNIQIFSGLELGWQSAYDWLEEQLALVTQ